MKDIMRSYELTFALKSDVSEVTKKKTLDSLKAFIKDLKIKEERELGKKVLSYDIKKQKEGIFFTLTLEGEKIPAGLEQKLINEENILRHLLVRTK